MSGNPFRRAAQQQPQPQQQQQQDLRPNRPAEDDTTLRTTQDDQSRTKKKRVVIQTPPHSPDSPTSDVRRTSTGRAGSPPPPSPPPPIAASQSYDSELSNFPDLDAVPTLPAPNAGRETGSLQAAPPTSFGVAGGMRAPNNPFQRTLATTEAAYGIQTSRTVDQEGDPTSYQNASPAGPGRRGLDVDAFKNILMTGHVDGPVSSGISLPDSRIEEKATKATPSARSPRFDPQPTTHSYSPRSSSDHDVSYSEDEDDSDQEETSLMGPIGSRPEELPPPAPPKPGEVRTFPQTVSFADFDQTIPTSLSSSHTSPSLTSTSAIRPSLPRELSDLNKPLPVPPATSAQKKAPPPPPASRRQGQGTPKGRERSASNLTQESFDEDREDDDALAKLRELSQKAVAPPPPRSRRSQIIQAAPTTAQENSPPAISSPPPSDPKTQPPPPPRRNPNKIGSSVARAPSTASRHSVIINETASNPNAPPLPPPRRTPTVSRRTSGERHLSQARTPGTDHRRPSTNSFESEKSFTSSSLRMMNGMTSTEALEESVPTPSGEPSERDILADMTAFQAEIDALRAQAAKGG